MSLKKQGYGSIAVAKTIGISLRQLYYWVDVLHATAPLTHQHGLRRFRRFSSQDLQRLKAIRGLTQQGYTLRAAIRIAKQRSR